MKAKLCAVSLSILGFAITPQLSFAQGGSGAGSCGTAQNSTHCSELCDAILIVEDLYILDPYNEDLDEALEALEREFNRTCAD